MGGTLFARRAGLVAALLLTGLVAAADLHGQRPGRTAPVPDAPAPGDTVPGDTTAERVREPDAVSDSIIAALLKLEGYIPTEYRADTAVYQAETGVLRLRGGAEVRRQGDQLNADSIVYRDRARLVEAYGEPKVTGSTQELTGDVLYYDLERRRASALGARTQVTQAATWFVTGDVTLQGTDRVYATSGHFTTCDLETPHYHFQSDKIKVVRERYLVARPARLYFGSVPVMWLPFIVQSLEKGRRSGLLVPRFSLSDVVRTNSDYTREISELGYYWAINDYLGAQLSGGWRSGAYTSLLGNLDFNWRRQFLNGNFAFRRFWEHTGGTQFSLNSRASWRPDERTNLALSGNFATSSRFVRESTYDPREATQDLISTLSMSRRFDWGTLSLGSDLRKSISDGDISGTLPNFTISPNPITLFRNPNVDAASWYNNATLAWNLSGSRTFRSNEGPIVSAADLLRSNQDDTRTRLQGGLTQLSFGNFNFSATGSYNQTLLNDLIGVDSTTSDELFLAGERIDLADWNASIGYQQRLIGQTMLTPNIGLSQQIQRDSLTGGRFLQAPIRQNVGVSLSSAIFGFFPGFGPFASLRHRVTPTLSYTYAPEIDLNEEQEKVFGASGGYAQNVVTLGFNQSWEAKLRDVAPADTTAGEAGDTTATGRPNVPTEPEKVTLLSINTSPLQYDFVRASREGNGWITERLSNSLTSDYLRGMSVQVEHELFDKSEIDPNNPADRGKLGSFSPRLSSLSTGFDLGPGSAIFRWLGLNADNPQGNEVAEGVQPGTAPPDEPDLPTSTGFTDNPRSVGGGDWRLNVNYSFSRSPRAYTGNIPEGYEVDDRGIQTLDLNTGFPLTANWGVNWSTMYSITDGEFSGHRLRFTRDLHRWQANFNFYQTPNGNSAFEFYVELTDNPDLKFEHHERNLGIDRRRAVRVRPVETP